MTIEALYEPLSFTVTIVSSLPYEGFVEAENCYLYTCEYTYGSSAIQLDDLSDVSGYWFGGFYTRPDGKGNQVNAVEGILSDTTYYVYWQDNTVRVRLYSDLELEGAQKDEEGYFIEKTFNDTYALSDGGSSRTAAGSLLTMCLNSTGRTTYAFGRCGCRRSRSGSVIFRST